MFHKITLFDTFSCQIKGKRDMRIQTQKRGPSIKVHFFANAKGINQVKLLPSSQSHGLKWKLNISSHSSLLEGLIEKWVDCYCKKRQPDVALPLVLDGLPPYTTKVLTVLREIPFGVSLTYQELAEITGTPRGARAAGSACGRNPFPLLIPCHRVLAQKGLGGFSGGLELKESLLAFEGISCC